MQHQEMNLGLLHLKYMPQPAELSPLITDTYFLNSLKTDFSVVTVCVLCTFGVRVWGAQLVVLIG